MKMHMLYRLTSVITNIGNYTAKPIINIYGYGTIEISVNGNVVFQYNFKDGNRVTIDSEKQDAYWNKFVTETTP